MQYAGQADADRSNKHKHQEKFLVISPKYSLCRNDCSPHRPASNFFVKYTLYISMG